jgi:hypothetical protein
MWVSKHFVTRQLIISFDGIAWYISQVEVIEVLCKLFAGIDTPGILLFRTLIGKVRIHFIYCKVNKQQ